MALQLHVWGPACGLPSIDAECLAAITYLTYALPASTDPRPWALVATSPSAVPTRECQNPQAFQNCRAKQPVLRPILPPIIVCLLTDATRSRSGGSCVTNNLIFSRPGRPPPPQPYSKLQPWTMAQYCNPIHMMMTPNLLTRRVDALPALCVTRSDTWISGFQPIVTYLSALDSRWDLDAHLRQEAAAAADLIAYRTFLQTTAPPLLALSLYVSSANWAATTRPAFSSLLPFPLAWTEPPALRKRMCDVAAHLGLSDLSIDAAAEDESSSSSSSTDDRGFLKIPERLRPRGLPGVRAALSPEQTALFRLEAVAGEGCLAVLEDLKRQGEVDGRRFFSFGHGKETRDRPTSLDCLAFAYLSLMLVPEVPRPWLRDLIRRRYECLSLFVDGIRDEILGGGDSSDVLPWQQQHPSQQQPWRLTRFARGVMTAIIPSEYLMPREKAPRNEAKQKTKTQLLRALARSLVGTSLVGGAAGLFLNRQYVLGPFGSAVYRWEVQRRRFGAAGAFFGI